MTSDCLSSLLFRSTKSTRYNRDATTIQTVSNIQISEKLIWRKIKAVKTNKATGPDEVTPKLLRIAEPEIVPPLTKLYSLSVEKGKVFDQWKTAHLCPVFKKDDPTDTSNYRPISLLSSGIVCGRHFSKTCHG